MSVGQRARDTVAMALGARTAKMRAYLDRRVPRLNVEGAATPAAVGD